MSILAFFRRIFKPTSKSQTPVPAPKEMVVEKKFLSKQSRMYFDARTRPDFANRVERARLKALANKDRYQKVADKCGCPWEVVAVIHNLEASFSFKKHLHNGDPLTARTVRVPAGCPKSGNPPFTWEESAEDVLRHKRFFLIDWQNLDEALDTLERFNGLGYRSRGIETPYLWSGTQFYDRGKFVKDGPKGFDPNAVSEQVGAVPLLKALGWFS